MTTDPKTGQEIVLVLQGGGALGAYQAGLYEELQICNYEPSWVAGISIGGINAAIIAGNAPEQRVARLENSGNRYHPRSLETSVWRTATSARLHDPKLGGAPHSAFRVLQAPASFAPLVARNTSWRTKLLQYAAPQLTLERLIDFDRINARQMRLSVGAVNVKTGNFTYFDNQKQKIGPEHIMASGAIPPGFPPIEIEGEFYWDGGLVSNTPIQYVLDEETKRDLLICQVDLFPARGDMPETMMAAAEREKDIRYSSRTRMNTDMSLKEHQVKTALRTHSTSCQKISEAYASIASSRRSRRKTLSPWFTLSIGGESPTQA
jgi:NTE family protein